MAVVPSGLARLKRGGNPTKRKAHKKDRVLLTVNSLFAREVDALQGENSRTPPLRISLEKKENTSDDET